MKRIIILALGLTLTGASCNLLTDTFGFAQGAKGVFRSEDGGQNFEEAATWDESNRRISIFGAEKYGKS